LRRPFLSLLATLLIVAGPVSASTILNTLQHSKKGGPGWSGGLDGMWSASGGNTEKVLLDAGARLQWSAERDRLRLQVSGSYEESAREVTARDIVAHLRHNRDLSASWATVAFTQAQSNPFQDLASRWLFGLGLRHDLLDDEAGTLAIGATPMLEIERLRGDDDGIARGRLSAFVSASRDLSDTARLQLSGFWQPLFDDLDDMRAIGNVGLSVDVTGSVDVTLGASVEYDTRPPAGVEDTDWKTYAGFGIDL
jgi:hypothetical protein